MRNNLAALNDYLFESIERIMDDSVYGEVLEEEIKKAEMVTDVAKVIVQNAELALKVMKHAEEYGIEKKEIPVMLTE
jgi:hypothetical protein